MQQQASYNIDCNLRTAIEIKILHLLLKSIVLIMSYVTGSLRGRRHVVFITEEEQKKCANTNNVRLTQSETAFTDYAYT